MWLEVVFFISVTAVIVLHSRRSCLKNCLSKQFNLPKKERLFSSAFLGLLYHGFIWLANHHSDTKYTQLCLDLVTLFKTFIDTKMEWHRLSSLPDIALTVKVVMVQLWIVPLLFYYLNSQHVIFFPIRCTQVLAYSTFHNLALSPDTLSCQSDKPLHSTTWTRFGPLPVQSWNLLPLQ